MGPEEWYQRPVRSRSSQSSAGRLLAHIILGPDSLPTLRSFPQLTVGQNRPKTTVKGENFLKVGSESVPLSPILREFICLSCVFLFSFYVVSSTYEGTDFIPKCFFYVIKLPND